MVHHTLPFSFAGPSTPLYLKKERGAREEARGFRFLRVPQGVILFSPPSSTPNNTEATCTRHPSPSPTTHIRTGSFLFCRLRPFHYKRASIEVFFSHEASTISANKGEWSRIIDTLRVACRGSTSAQTLAIGLCLQQVYPLSFAHHSLSLSDRYAHTDTHTHSPRRCT